MSGVLPIPEFDWRELPYVITLAPGITVSVPKRRLANARDIWPLSDVKTMDKYPEDRRGAMTG